MLIDKTLYQLYRQLRGIISGLIQDKTTLSLSFPIQGVNSLIC
jgi:hypothetical protein